jgi:threonine aldolase
VIDLFSDTLTKPTPEMRRFMCEAEVGDEQKGEDPTVNLLQEMVADLLGKEAALYLPSGTMCNEIAVKVHTRPGDEVLADRTSHLIHYEGGGPGLLSGVIMTSLDGERGVFAAAQVRAAMRPRSRYMPPTRLVSVENTSNLGGGRVWPLATVEEVGAAARALELASHMDGARLMNAVVASGTPARAYAAAVDSVWIDFSKGLGAPVGACLAGSRAFIQEAWRYKQALGGAMRQAGIIAAGGVYALRHHVDRLAEDHDNARAFARGIAALPGIALDPAHVETNIVIFDVTASGLTAQGLADRLQSEAQVRLSVMGETRLRAVTHLDVSRKQVDAAVEAMARLLKNPGWRP